MSTDVLPCQRAGSPYVRVHPQPPQRPDADRSPPGWSRRSAGWVLARRWKAAAVHSPHSPRSWTN